jgi:hypothetical protein
VKRHSLAPSGNTDNRLREAYDVIVYSTMSPSGFSKLWYPRRYGRKRGDKRDTRHTLTIGNGRLPIETLQEIFSNLDLWTLLRCCNVCRLWNQCIPGDSPYLRIAMYLPVSKHNTFHYETAAIKAFRFNFAVTLHGDFQDVEDRRICRPVTDYTVCLRSSETKRLQKYDITINPILLPDMTQSQLQRYKALWESSENKKPFWMTMLVSRPPIQRLTIHFKFLDTALVLEECWVLPHTTSRTLVNPTGIVLGDLLSATHDSMWWGEMRLSRKEKHDHVSTRLVPSIQQEMWEKNEGPPVLDKDMPVLRRESSCSR